MKANCPGGSSAAFFQFPKEWEKLKNEIIPDIVSNHPEGEILRVWVAPCSTGQWAYSVTIAFLEVIEEIRPNIQLQVIATDIDNERIEFAKKGLYLKNIEDITPVSGVCKERLGRFFNKKWFCRGYQVKKEVMELTEFSVHDLVDDPAYKDISFLSCQWLLHWFPFEVKKKFISRFMDAIIPGGVLFLDHKVYYRKRNWIEQPNEKQSI